MLRCKNDALRERRNLSVNDVQMTRFRNSFVRTESRRGKVLLDI